MNPAQTNESQSFLQSLLTQQASPESLQWLQQKSEKLRYEFSEKEFYLAFSLLPRFFGKEKLSLTEAQLHQANHLRTGFNPSELAIVQVARILLALYIPKDDA